MLKDTLINLSISVVTLILLLLVLEVGAHLYVHKSDRTLLKYGSIFDLKEYALTHPSLKVAHPYLTFVGTPNYRNGRNRHNHLGYRGDEFPVKKPEGEFRIVCMGGSTTYSVGIEDYKLSYPYLLEKELHKAGYPNVRVINAGNGGWTSWESMINYMIRVVDLEPDVIVIYHAVNDIHARFVWPASAYKGDNSGRKKMAELIYPPLQEYSALYRIFATKIGLMEPHNAMSNSLDQAPPEFMMAKLQASGFDEKGVNRLIAKPGQQLEVPPQTMLDANRPIYFKRNLENMIAVAKFRKTKVVLASMAHIDDFEHHKSSTREYMGAFDEMNNLIRQIAQETNTYFFDYANLFPKDKNLFRDGYHVNEAGSPVQAKLFGQFLMEQHLVPHKQQKAS